MNSIPDIRRAGAALLAIICWCAFASNPAAAQGNQFTAGFMEIPAGADAPKMGIWYPSVTAETEDALGPFPLRWAREGVAAAGKFPVVIISHGRSGFYRNHHGTAADFARRGYIVIAPDHHNTDLALQPPRIIAPITARAREIHLALTAALQQPAIAAIADTNRLGAIGYSLGTLTALYAGGAKPSMHKFIQHCLSHRAADPEFCGGDWRVKLFAWLRAKGILKTQLAKPLPAEKEFQNISPPIKFHAIALMAPVGAPFSPAQLRNLNAAVAIYRFSDDAQLRYPFHAEHLRQAFAKNSTPVAYHTFAGVHHGAFNAKLPQHILDAEEDPIAHDPPGFDREEFLRDANARLLNFFNANL